eukprot:6210343-Pyramimonas_sp.AAC.1
MDRMAQAGAAPALPRISNLRPPHGRCLTFQPCGLHMGATSRFNLATWVPHHISTLPRGRHIAF